MNGYKIELKFAKQLALKSRKIITKTFLHSTVTTKSNLTPVTETDIAVSKMIIENAGGICTGENDKRLTVFGNPQYFIATNKKVHEEVMEIVQKCLHK